MASDGAGRMKSQSVNYQTPERESRINSVVYGVSVILAIIGFAVVCYCILRVGPRPRRPPAEELLRVR